MRLSKAKVTNYRSARDSEEFEIEFDKTILVGPNEAGKSAVLQALQQINAPEGVKGFDALRDYPRALYNDISTGKVDPAKTTVVEVGFTLEEADQEAIPEEFHDCVYKYGRRLDNTAWHELDGGPKVPVYGDAKKELLRLATHANKQFVASQEDTVKPSDKLATLSEKYQDNWLLHGPWLKPLRAWIDETTSLVDESNKTEENRLDRINQLFSVGPAKDEVKKTLSSRRPVFVLFSNYFRVRPLIHLEHLAQRLETNVLDDESYDYGNTCLLKLLGFEARELSDLGKAEAPDPSNAEQLQKYKDQLDQRSYQLNAASVRLTNEIRSVWQPNPDKPEADRLKVVADGQYLKVVVEDDLGVEIELDQRSEGFQWLVSFFVVFFAEAADQYENAILLLDEPGLSLHGLKQREFRNTISRLAASNQVLYTTHSPFLVGPDELDRVRVVEMTDRNVGTKVHTDIVADDPAAMLPLQEALGYDLAQSLFSQERNLILEGLTDFWYLESIAELLRDSGEANLNDKIALISANGAGKVVYYATILHAHNLKVAALLDSDAAGENAAQQETLVHRLGNKKILRTKDVYTGEVNKPEIEDLLRETLIRVARDDLGWDISGIASTQSSRPIIDCFESEIVDFSKYRLAKAFVRWTRAASTKDLTEEELESFKALIDLVNKALK